jgi:hypothetical protein
MGQEFPCIEATFDNHDLTKMILLEIFFHHLFHFPLCIIIQKVLRNFRPYETACLLYYLFRA